MYSLVYNLCLWKLLNTFIQCFRYRDEDMQSLASLMSSTQNDIAPLDDFEGEDDGKSLKIIVLLF